MPVADAIRTGRNIVPILKRFGPTVDRTCGADRRRGSTERATVTKTTGPDVSIVIPAFNEAERITPTLVAIAEHMDASGRSWELILADDGSTDATVENVLALGLPSLTVLRSSANGGKGKAVRRGMLAAEGDMILFADADQSTPIAFIDDLIAEIESGFDVAIGSRAADGSLEQSKPFTRRLLSGGLRFLVKLLFRLGVKDTQCGFKLFTRVAARDLFSRQRMDGFSFDLEVLYLASTLGYSISEVPVTWHDMPGSTVDAARVASHFLRDLVSIRLDDLRGRYRIRANSGDPAAKAEASVTG